MAAAITIAVAGLSSAAVSRRGSSVVVVGSKNFTEQVVLGESGRELRRALPLRRRLGWRGCGRLGLGSCRWEGGDSSVERADDALAAVL